MSTKPEQIDMLKLLKEVVDSVTEPHWPKDLGEQYAQLNLSHQGFQSWEVVGKEIDRRIVSSIGSHVADKSCSHIRILDQLVSELVYREVLEGEPASEYIKVINALKYALRNSVKYFRSLENKPEWTNAVEDSKRLIQASPGGYGLIYDDLRESFPREFDVAVAVKFLAEKGCKYQYFNGRLEITSGLEKVFTELESLVSRFGGANLMTIIFQHLNLSNRYSDRYQRFHIYRTASMMVSDQQRQIPFGFLLHLCLKHPNYKFPSGLTQGFDNPQAIFEFASYVVQAAYDVQVYNRWEFINKDGGDILALCRQIVLWDNIFALPQARMSLSLEIAEELFQCIEDGRIEKSLGLKKSEFFEICRAIENICGDFLGPVVFSAKDLKLILPMIEMQRLVRVIGLLTHPRGFNERYSKPANLFENDFFKKPIIQLADGRLMIPQKSWSAPNYFESLASSLRPYFPKMDSDIGLELERFLIRKLSSKGFQIVVGKYAIGKIEGETDILLVTDSILVIIECKKKNLTRAAKSGTAYGLLIDLSESLLSAHIQTGKVELLMRQVGSLIFKGANNLETEVMLSDRQIIRIALTLSDYAGFHDRAVMGNFLESLISHSFTISNGSSHLEDRFAELEKKRQKWVRQFQELEKLDTFIDTYPFRDLMFMNLVQFLETLEDSKDPISFVSKLIEGRHINYGTLDYFFERNLVSLLKDGHQE
ncbi:hypothetical protein GM921_03965 [Pedobacter sp. LMG 31464]|uniref:NERD domain-containing protein n=1 Tax=Pedobacter planticolens TaxID=2679964 RepID=A0A923DX15_9SPHI|nr:hypothetical protein [Pedobacter planticolens]MBB2144626.1 hypothetical protein [Pedobacter planticolens]